MTALYGISSLDEARAYLAHKLLGSRLDLCTRIVLTSESLSLGAFFRLAGRYEVPVMHHAVFACDG